MSTVNAATASPAIRVKQLSGGSFSASGEGFPRSTAVSIEARNEDCVGEKTLRTSASGAFELNFELDDRCTGELTVRAVSGSTTGTANLTMKAASESTGTSAPNRARPEASQDLMPVSEWQARFDESWESKDAAEYQELSTSGDSWDQYHLAYGLDGNVAMFQASGDTKYLDNALRMVSNVMDTAVPSSQLPNSQFSDEYMAWANHSHSEIGDDGQEYPLFESYFWRYITSMLTAMQQNEEIRTDADYQAQFDEILDFTETNIFDKWMSRGEDNIYRSRTHMASHWAMISLNLSNLTNDSERKDRYTEIFTSIDRKGIPGEESSLRDQMQTTENGGYFWSDVWGETTAPGQDVSHGNNVVSYMVHANGLDSEWTDDDMKALAITFEQEIWRPDGSGAEFLDGSGNGNSWFNDGFAKLGRFEPAIQQRLETHDTGRNVQLFGNGALNAFLLGA